MDLSTVRADIKNWERSFKSANGRDPTIQDIRDQPPIAEKYKLYKKLSKFAVAAKSAQSTSNQSHLGPPSTPPSSRQRVSQVQPSLILSKSRAIETTAPLSTFNPFSPQKNKGKQKQKQFPSATQESPSNPFRSPLKLKSRIPIQKRSLSPDLFPATQPIGQSSTIFAPKSPPPAQTSALSRARKRLRGEPVSPSPNKEKRLRANSQITLPYPRLGLDSPTSDGEDDAAANSSFVDDSPVKAPAGGKSFKLLFEDTTAPISLPKGKLKRTKPTPVTSSLFGQPMSLLSRVDGFVERGSNKIGQREHTSKKTVAGHFSAGEPVSRTDVPFTTRPLNQMQLMTNKHGKVDLLELRTSVKRSFSDTDVEPPDVPAQPITANLPLLPPSPPPESSSQRARYDLNAQAKGKSKAKTSAGRKKTKVNDKGVEDGDDEDDGTGVINSNVKVIDRTHTRYRATKLTAEDLEFDFDSDPIIGYSRPVGPYAANLDLANGNEMGKFEVNLPDELRRVLALESAESKARDIREERLVKGLVYGRKANHYDPIKGGEIWDVGEDGLRSDGEDFTRRDTEGEDDWEGEPIPWEVGEL